MSSVAEALLNEIERVVAKRERWRMMMKRTEFIGANLAAAIALMTVAIDLAKRSFLSDDPADSVRALAILRGYDNDD
jgi:hypothetical protein